MVGIALTGPWIPLSVSNFTHAFRREKPGFRRERRENQRELKKLPGIPGFLFQKGLLGFGPFKICRRKLNRNHFKFRRRWLSHSLFLSGCLDLG